MPSLHGLNFRDETLWRGRMLAFTFAMRGIMSELGAWVAALVIAYQLDAIWPRYQLVTCVAAVMLVRMVSAHFDDWRKLKGIEKDLGTYIDQA
jgi:hypothetical protein